MNYRITASIAENFTTRNMHMNMRIVIIILITLMTLMASCMKTKHPEHIPGLSCPKFGHGDCPYGCEGR